jgi:hypothetical protein
MGSQVQKMRARRIQLSKQQEDLLLELYDAPVGMTVTVSKFQARGGPAAFYVKWTRDDGEVKTDLMDQEDFYSAIELTGEQHG